MKLFDKFEIVKFPEENLLFVTFNGYLYYIYDPKYDRWRKHKSAGNDSITVDNYQEVDIEEIIEAMHGVYPRKETDFTRLCDPSQLWVKDMLALLTEDYPRYMANYDIRQTVDWFLLNSDICCKTFEKIKALFDDAISRRQNEEQVITHLKDLSFAILGRDIYKRQIDIVDGHDSSSYFWIMPVSVLDYSDTNDIDFTVEMRSAEISIEEDDVAQYLTPFLYKYFDDELEANKKREYKRWTDEEGKEQESHISGFEWYLTYNYYTFDAISNILKDINDTINALSSGRENEYTAKLKEKRGTGTYRLLYAKDLTDEQIKIYNDNRPTEDDTETDLIVDFYRRFVYRLEYMMTVGRENGYNMISFMGP